MRPGRAVVTRQARNDLLQIWEFIAADSLDAADRVLATLEADIERLAEVPGLGHHRPEVPSKSVRFWLVYSYLIIYRTDRDPIHVIGVVHGARNLPDVLRGR